MSKDFFSSTSIINYSVENYEKSTFSQIDEIIFNKKTDSLKWLNIYGFGFKEEINTIIKNNQLDDFLLKLLMEKKHPNKVIQLEKLLFISIRVLKSAKKKLDSEQMIFIVSEDFVWSIQEKPGDHFGWIRERLENNRGIVRKKNTDYLLFLLLESIIDNYETIYEKYADFNFLDNNQDEIKPTPDFTALIEERKQMLFTFKKATMSLRDIVVKLEKTEWNNMQTKYFIELKEQINNLISDIDFDFHKLESKINLIFSIQGHRLNEVMKTLTIFSVIFIPLTFIAGIYGMNFENMPELKSQNGYFILIGVMFIITLVSVWIFKRKKWF